MNNMLIFYQNDNEIFKIFMVKPIYKFQESLLTSSSALAVVLHQRHQSTHLKAKTDAKARIWY